MTIYHDMKYVMLTKCHLVQPDGFEAEKESGGLPDALMLHISRWGPSDYSKIRDRLY
jgi:hypothetical protein